MNVRSRRFRVLRGLGIGVASAVVLLAGLFVLRPPIELGFVRRHVAAALSGALECDVTIEHLVFRPGATISVEIGRLEACPQDGSLHAAVDSALVDLRLWDLLRRRLEVDRVAARGAVVEFRPTPTAEEKPDNEKEWDGDTGKGFAPIRVRHLMIEDARLTLSSKDGQGPLTIDLARVDGTLGSDLPTALRLSATVGGQEVGLEVEAGALGELRAGRSWPIELRADLLGAHARASGALEMRGAGLGLVGHVSVHGESLGSVLAAAGVDVPDLGPFDLESEVSLAPRMVSLGEVRAQAGGSRVSGSLSWVAGGDSDRIEGSFAVDTIDLRVWGKSGPPGQIGGQSSGGSTENLEHWPPGDIEASVELEVESVVGLPLEVRDLRLAGELENSVLAVEGESAAAGATLKGRLTADLAGETPLLRASLDGRNVELAPWRQILRAPAGLDVSVRSVQLKGDTRGRDVAEWLGRLDLAGRLSSVVATADRDGNEEALRVELDTLALAQPPGGGLHVDATGSWRDLAFEIGVDTSNLAELPGAASIPVRASVEAGGAAATIAGAVRPGPAGLALDLTVAADGPRIGTLAPWVGVASSAEHPFRADLDLSVEPGRFVAEVRGVEIGASALRARAKLEVASPRPMLDLDIMAARLEVPELLDLMELEARESPASAAGPLHSARDARHERLIGPILGSMDAVVRLGISEMALEVETVENLAAELSLRDGSLSSSNVRFGLAGAAFSGSLLLDASGDVPEWTVEALARGFDVGAVLAAAGVAETVELVVDELHLEVQATGASVQEMAETYRLGFRASNLDGRVLEPGSDTWLSFRIDEASWIDGDDDSGALRARGSWAALPIEIRADVSPPGEDARYPLEAQIAAGSTRLSVATTFSLPLDRTRAILDVSLAGENMADLEQITPLDFEEGLAYSGSAVLELSPGSYALRDLDLRFGASDLSGELRVDATAEPFEVEAALRSQLLQLGDGTRPEGEPEHAAAGEAERGTDVRALLRSVNADLTVQIDELRVAGGSVGSTDLGLEVQNGVLTLRQMGVQEKGGAAEVVVSVDATEDTLNFSGSAYLRRYEYGPLLRFLDPDGDSEGALSLVADLGSRRGPERLLERSSGSVVVTLFPEALSPALLDLWARPLWRLIAGGRTPKSGTGFNCVAGAFDLENGILVPDQLVADTEGTRLRISGRFDLPASTLDLRLKPRPKRPGMIDLAIPARVHGRMDDPVFTISKKGAALKLVKFSYWVVTVWGEIFRRTLPADGSDVCVDPVRS